jgi:hypothetical protein
MIHRGTTRESRRRSHHSTPEEKLRRHRNKYRIWRRCVIKLARKKAEKVQAYDVSHFAPSMQVY